MSSFQPPSLPDTSDMTGNAAVRAVEGSFKECSLQEEETGFSSLSPFSPLSKDRQSSTEAGSFTQATHRGESRHGSEKVRERRGERQQTGNSKRSERKEGGSGQGREGSRKGMKRTASAPGLSFGDGGEEDMPKVTVGVCAMDKKARSKQMRAIVERLLRYNEFEVVIFGDDVILHKPVEEWPVVTCLLSWHSEGFPLKKSQAYAALRKPYMVNDVFEQDILLDRRKVYRRLVESGIPAPVHIIVDRDTLPPDQQDPPGFEETEDYVELNGVRIHKPFVEKPASGEDHNVHIYYPHSMGGGVKRLFRKIDNKSADYDPNHPGTVRRDGSYIYEEFLTTGGTDVKVYTVGPRYAHAEARKSPVVDGKVQRTADGKEVRFPVLLSPQEKEIARMVCLAFGQRVCGFDLLRSERGKSYVCDVNGWSFVKNSQKYYDDAAGILRMIILSAVAPHRLVVIPPPPLSVSDIRSCGPGAPAPAAAADSLVSSAGLHYTPSFDDVRSPAPGAVGGDAGDDGRHAGEELRCVLAVVRHGDRTPKQKMKMRVTQPVLLDLLHKYLDSKGKQAKLKSPNELQELLDATRQLLCELEDRQQHKVSARSSGIEGYDEATKSGEREDVSLDPEADELREKLRIVKTVLEQGGGQFAGINRKAQLKPLRWSTPEEGSKEGPRCIEALLILKHGGILTHAGRVQAEALGSLFRNIMYPNHGPTGGGLLRLHSTYRHDLKIYSSDEGRVQTSAAAFTKGLLDLEGAALTPILVSLVKKDASMLDAFGKGASVDINAAKQELYAQMTYDPKTKSSQFAAPALFSPMVPVPPPSPDCHPAGSGATSSNSRPASGGGVAPADLEGKKAGSESDSALTNLPHSAGNGNNDTLNGDGDSTSLPGVSNIPGRQPIYPMPEDSLSLLHKLHDLLKLVVEELRQKCLEEVRLTEGSKQKSYSALTQDPQEWKLEDGKPCSGEKLLLMFDRWRKLAKAFFNEKKGQFDISKVPDIYDAAKYDAIHNLHLELVHLQPVYDTSKVLATAVIPNEYGILPVGKLRIGAMICGNLLGKLLADLASMREESVATSGLVHQRDDISVKRGTETADSEGTANVSSFVLSSSSTEKLNDSGSDFREGSSTKDDAVSSSSKQSVLGGNEGTEDDDDEEPVGNEHEQEEDDAVLHRLCPTYAQDVNSPLRHVRTRIYFTSESHCHSLMNVLKHCQLGPAVAGLTVNGGQGGNTNRSNGNDAMALLSAAGQELLHSTPELDYMTHIVLRMFENKSLPLNHPGRFRVEILFSPGAAHNPFEVVPLRNDHVVPIVPRVPIHCDAESGVSLDRLEKALKPFSKHFKAPTDPYRGIGPPVQPEASELEVSWM